MCSLTLPLVRRETSSFFPVSISIPTSTTACHVTKRYVWLAFSYPIIEDSFYYGSLSVLSFHNVDVYKLETCLLISSFISVLQHFSCLSAPYPVFSVQPMIVLKTLLTACNSLLFEIPSIQFFSDPSRFLLPCDFYCGTYSCRCSFLILSITVTVDLFLSHLL